MPITPSPGLTNIVAGGGLSVLVIPAEPQGGFITNPLLAADQGVTAEVLYVDPTGSAPTLHANGTCFALQPGQSWTVIPGQTTTTSVTSVTSGHKFSAVWW